MRFPCLAVPPCRAAESLPNNYPHAIFLIALTKGLRTHDRLLCTRCNIAQFMQNITQCHRLPRQRTKCAKMGSWLYKQNEHNPRVGEKLEHTIARPAVFAISLQDSSSRPM